MTEQEQAKNYHITDIIKKIKSFLSSDKPADVMIIKAHLLCEYYMNHLLILREICSAKEIESLTFFNKLEKVKSIFNLNDEIHKKTYEKMKSLNRIRNKVGHDLEYKLSESDVDTLGYLDGKEYILSKYNIETDVERLRIILIDTVIGISSILNRTIEDEKDKMRK